MGTNDDDQCCSPLAGQRVRPLALAIFHAIRSMAVQSDAQLCVRYHTATVELLTKQLSDHSDLKRDHVWGAPTYVLEPKLQDGKKIPKWHRRSRCGQYLGFSAAHSSLISVVRNLRTG